MMSLEPDAVLFQALYEIGSDLLKDALLNVPVVLAPNHEASIEPMNHDFVCDLGVLSQVGRDEDASLPVNLFIGGESEEEFQGAKVIVIGDGEAVKAGRDALPFACGVANQAPFLASDNYHNVVKQLAKPCGQVETSTIIET
jgi:hypothetical protein